MGTIGLDQKTQEAYQLQSSMTIGQCTVTGMEDPWNERLGNPGLGRPFTFEVSET